MSREMTEEEKFAALYGDIDLQKNSDLLVDEAVGKGYDLSLGIIVVIVSINWLTQEQE